MDRPWGVYLPESHPHNPFPSPPVAAFSGLLPVLLKTQNQSNLLKVTLAGSQFPDTISRGYTFPPWSMARIDGWMSRPISIDVSGCPACLWGFPSFPPRLATDHLFAPSVFTRRTPPARASITQRIAYAIGNVSSARASGLRRPPNGGRELGRRCRPSRSPRPFALQFYRCRSSVHVAPKVSTERDERSEEGTRINYVSQSVKPTSQPARALAG